MKNKLNAVVIGGSSGLGLEILKQLDVNDINVQSVSRSEGTDITNLNEYAVKIEQIVMNQPIDIFIYAAGISENTPKSIFEVSYDEFKNIRTVNYDGLFYSIQKILPAMIERNEGVFCYISSMAAIKPHPLLPIYSSTKSASQNLIASIGKYLHEINSAVRCFSVSPNGINTKLRQRLFKDSEKQQSAEVVARNIVTLITDQSVSFGLNWQLINGDIKVP